MKNGARIANHSYQYGHELAGLLIISGKNLRQTGVRAPPQCIWCVKTRKLIAVLGGCILPLDY